MAIAGLYTAQGPRLVCSNGYVLVQYPSGELKSRTISAALTIGSVQCDRLSQVELTPDGTIVRCEWFPLVAVGAK